MKSFMLFLVVGVLMLSVLACGSDVFSSSTTLTIINNTQTITFCHLYTSPAGNSDWSDDKLLGNQIAPGESYSLDVEAEIYDLKITDCDGASEVRYNAHDFTDESLEWTLTEDEPTVKIINNTQSITFCYLYISPAGSGEQGEEKLQGSQVAPGIIFTIPVESGIFDLRITDCSGTLEVIQEGQDLSAPFEWTLTD